MSEAPRRKIPSAAQKRGLHPMAHLLIAVIVIGLLQGFVIKLYAIPSASMEPTMETGDRILVNRLAYMGSEPQIGDVIVFRADEQWGPSPAEDDLLIERGIKWLGSLIGIGPGIDHIMTKRVVAVGGQTIECCNAEGDILVDGESLAAPPGPDLPFSQNALDCTTETKSTRCFTPIPVPEGTVVVAGDNRANSFDSLTACRQPEATDSCLLTVQTGDIIGTVVFVVAPLSRFGGI